MVSRDSNHTLAIIRVIDRMEISPGVIPLDWCNSVLAVSNMMNALSSAAVRLDANEIWTGLYLIREAVKGLPDEERAQCYQDFLATKTKLTGSINSGYLEGFMTEYEKDWCFHRVRWLETKLAELKGLISSGIASES